MAREAEAKYLYKNDEPFVPLWKEACRGRYPSFDGVDFTAYHSLRTFLYQSFGGRIPVLFLGQREEFERLICQIFYGGRRREIPPSMGALTIKGWKDAEGRLHRAILLGDGYYSGVSPQQMGQSGEEWRSRSFLIRLNHECAHYYTLRAFGFMENALRDELIADAMGIAAAFGEYRADYFLLFMGLEDRRRYREGGRLQNYLPAELKGEERQRRLARMGETARQAALGLEAWLKGKPQYLSDDAGRLRLLNKLVQMGEPECWSQRWERP